MSMQPDIYTDGEYLRRNPTWDEEDSPWKAEQISRMISRNNLSYRSVCEVGCGAGAILQQLSLLLPKDVVFDGYEISPQAYEMAKQKQEERLRFHLKDLMADEGDTYDILLVIDVFEHVPDYIGFIRGCSSKAKYKIYHIPLDVHVSSVLRSSLTNARDSVGHLHYFTAETALATVKDSGQKILDVCYTDGGIALQKLHPSTKRTLANIPRRILSKFSVPLTARLLGGYSLLVLAE